MIIKDILSSDVAVKVFYAYIAVSLGHTGVQTVSTLKPDILEVKITHVEKRLERMENMIIDVLKSKAER